MKDKYHLSPTETEIMERLWQQDQPIRQTQLLDMFNKEGKTWGRQALNTLLIRLEGREFVRRERRKVWAALSREEFGAKIIGEAVDHYFDGDRERAATRMCRNTR